MYRVDEFDCLAGAKVVVEEMDLITGTDGRLYQYDGNSGIWKYAKKNHIKLYMARLLEAETGKVRYCYITEMLNIIETIKPMPEGTGFNQNRNILVLKNGIYDLERSTFHPEFSKELYATVQINANYDPQASNQRFIQFLNEVFLEDIGTIEACQKMMGYLLTTDTSQQKAFFFLGEGQDGKSVLLKVIQELVGGSNVSNIPFHKLENHHYIAELDGKLVNIGSEIESKGSIATSNFKAIVSGDWIQADPKYIQPFKFKPIAKMIFAGNELPRISDRSFGLNRRILIFPFHVRFVGAREDKALEGKLLAELDGIFLWALEGLSKLKTDGEFNISELMEKAKTEFEVEMNPLITFIEEHCEKRLDLRIPKSVFRERYQQWCEENKYRALSTNVLSKELKRLGIETQKSGADRFYTGVNIIGYKSILSEWQKNRQEKLSQNQPEMGKGE